MFVSIKWKLSLSFVLLGFGLVGAYVLLATKTFESDKIAYVFDSQQEQVEAIATDLGHKIEHVKFLAGTVLSTADVDKMTTLPPTAENLLKNQTVIQSLELFDPVLKQRLVQFAMKPGLPPPEMPQFTPDQSAPDYSHLEKTSDGRFIFLTNLSYGNNIGPRLMRVVIDLGEVLPPESTQSYALLDGTEILETSGTNKAALEHLSDVVNDFKTARAQETSYKTLNGEKYLFSTSKLPFGSLRLVTYVSEAEALGALKILFKRSVVFIAFSVFLTIFIALFLSRGLTGNLQELTTAALRIGQGHFADPVKVKSNDEVGVLSGAFEKMGGEIERLLFETKDKTRMEQELKTASLVQESLFPKERQFSKDQLGVAGLCVTATECSGDWWFYFERGDDLFAVIADATGHGTPAALITAGARALFSKLVNTKDSLVEMARDWDEAVAATSGQKVFMTAFLIRINSKTGEGAFINACHEPPIVLRRGDDGTYKGEYLEMNMGATLGERTGGRFEEQAISLAPGDKLLLYTDGLFSVEDAAGQGFSERRMLSSLAKDQTVATTALDLVQNIEKRVNDHRAGLALPDDVTTLAIVRLNT
jgi:sigma-B regulation protein RsbU (phosphoserine phosphatase)